MEHVLKNLYSHYVSSGQFSPDSEQYRKLIILNISLYVTCFTLIVFSSLQNFVFNTSNYMINTIELISGLIIIYALYDLKYHQNIERIAKLTTATLFLFLLSFIYINQNQSFGIIWMIFLPIYAMTVNGPKLGLQITFGFLTILLLLAYNSIGHWQSGLWDQMSFIRLTVASLILTFIIYANERSLATARRQEQLALEELRKLSTLDELTQIANRRSLNKELSSMIHRADRYESPLCIALFDIDNFKQINDQYGHLAGDAVLQQLADIVKHELRCTDILGRWGGEEFLVILPQDDLTSTRLMSEKLRQTIAKTVFTGTEGHITCSFGITQFEKSLNLDQMIERADKALYLAKDAGKNKVMTYKPHQKRVTSPLTNYIG